MSIRILVVDDNVDIINNVREYLSLKGWTVEWCTTGPDALRRLQADPFDLLILDLGLPGLDGLTICRELRAAHSKLPILMLTGRDAIDDRVRGFEAGTDDYLVKPFSLRELAARVEALLRRSYGVSEKVLCVADLEMNLETMRSRARAETSGSIPSDCGFLRSSCRKVPRSWGAPGSRRFSGTVRLRTRTVSDPTSIVCVRKWTSPLTRPSSTRTPGSGGRFRSKSCAGASSPLRPASRSFSA